MQAIPLTSAPPHSLGHHLTSSQPGSACTSKRRPPQIRGQALRRLRHLGRFNPWSAAGPAAGVAAASAADMAAASATGPAGPMGEAAAAAAATRAVRRSSISKRINCFLRTAETERAKVSCFICIAQLLYMYRPVVFYVSPDCAGPRCLRVSGAGWLDGASPSQSLG